MYAPSRTIYRQIIPGLVLGGIVILGLALMGNMVLVGHNLIKFQWKFFALAIALTFLNQTLRFLKQSYYLHLSGVRGVSLLESFRLFVASFPLVATPKRVNESFKGIWLFKASGLPVERSVTLFIVDQISNGLSVFVLMVIGTFAYPTLWPLFLTIFVAFLAATIYLRIKPNDSNSKMSGGSLIRQNKLVLQLQECVDCNPELFSARSLVFTIFIGILSWAAEGAALFYILVGLGFIASLPLVATAILVFAFSSTIGLVSSIPGGLGVVELAMSMMLTLLLNFKPEIAVSATILFRLAAFWISFLLGVFLWSVSGKTLGLSHGEGHIVEG
jgi:glycosyltransferase 2 family protein